MVSLYILFFTLILLSFFVSLSRFLSSLIILENFNILLLISVLLLGGLDSHMSSIILMVVSTIEIVLGLVVLTRVWECTNSLDLISF
uniref:NADH dehydrogenase subunit 4L n=1 Tax=Nippotaenia chaenogobii TaxID=137592 RepID=R4I295_9CEST|nr:NADH dehydrogenase subunit 4L [Nippotaenia chaenogobii]